MSTQIPVAETPIEEMSHKELIAEVKRLRSETGSNMPHPAVWANAERLHKKAVNVPDYFRLSDSAKRAVEALGLLIDIHNWDPTSA